MELGGRKPMSPLKVAERASGYRIIVTIFGVGILMVAGWLAFDGAELILAGGSSYYAIAGLGILCVGACLIFQRVEGVYLYLIIYTCTIIWAMWEVGICYWPLFARLFTPTIMLFVFLLIIPVLRPSPRVDLFPGTSSRWAASATLLALIIFFSGAFMQHDVIVPNDDMLKVDRTVPAGVRKTDDWRYVGSTPSGTRFAVADQITPQNVNRLRLAWQLRTGDMGGLGAAFEATPIQVDETLYTCTPNNRVLAINADTGATRWLFDPHVKPGIDWRKCRGVAYFRPPAGAAGGKGECSARIITNTIDTRLIALDAVTGRPCHDFGTEGIVDLKKGMGEILPGEYLQTSAPTVVGGLIIVGGWVLDNLRVGEPGGVIRAFDAETGSLVWAWDPGDPNVSRYPEKNGQYTRGTPNVWAQPSVDEKAGLIYLPVGNPTPDYWGALRRPLDEAFGSSVVALDAKSGRVRWKFQTVHHDLWDFDLASQPLLYDLPDGKGGVVPALIQLTKQGQIFMLNRLSGTPIVKVAESRVPQHGQPGERLSPMQPISVGMPSIGAETLTERSMWGLTPVDQLWCRRNFRSMHYGGPFTPATTERGSIIYPGPVGGFNWGSGAIDERRGYLIVGDSRVPFYLRLLTPSAYQKILKGEPAGRHAMGIVPMTGTPYGADVGVITSPLGVMCKQPPYGTLTAIDLVTRKIVWQKPAGTTEDVGPLEIPTRMRFPVGLPTIGGPMITASGLMFFSGTQDQYLRAYDVRSGKELWRARLPVGSTATPMTYRSPRTGKQYVLVSAGGAVAIGTAGKMPKGDYIFAYAVP